MVQNLGLELYMEAAKLWWIAARRRRLSGLAAGAILLADGCESREEGERKSGGLFS